MTVDFYKSHVETLCELKELAYKHNCNIAFGVRNDSNPELGFDDCDEIFPDNILEDLKRCGDIVKGWSNATCLWFELYDRNTARYHNMTYVDGDYYIEYDRFYSEEVEEETQKWIEENGYELVAAEFTRLPNVDLKVLEGDAKADIEKLIERIEEDDDVQNVYTTMQP